MQPVLPGRRLGSKAALGAGAQPIAELRRNVAERAFHAELQRGVHWPVRIVEDLPADGDQIGLPVAQDLFGLIAMDDEAATLSVAAPQLNETLVAVDPVV